MSEVERFDPDVKYIGTGDYVGCMSPCVNGDYVLATAYDAETARAEQAEADVKERDEIILETHRRVEQAEADNAALVDACRKVFSITIDGTNAIRQWDTALCELDELSKQPHPGAALLEEQSKYEREIVHAWEALGIELDGAHEHLSDAIKYLLERHAAVERCLRDLVEQVESLEGYQLTRDIEPYKAQANWDDILERAEAELAGLRDRIKTK